MLLLSAGLVWGCLIIPVKETAVSGDVIAEEQLAFIESGVTTRREVLDRLGEPDVIWEQEQILAYNWTTRHAIVPWVAPAPYSAAGGVEDITRDYVLLIQFGDDDRVSQYEITTRSTSDSYGKHLAKWAEPKGRKR
jgi:hypothetical protein